LGIRGGLLLFLFSLAVLLPGTVGVSFVDRDEGWYAQVCREMLESGDWLIPRYLGEVWLAKPPLLYWLVSSSFYLLGLGEWQARLVPVLATAISVVLMGMLASRMFDRRVGVLAGVLFITCGLPLVVGKMLLTDGPMLTCILAVVLLHWSMAEGRVTHLRAAGYWLAMGLGILAKGPAVLVFAGGFGLALLCCNGWRGWFWNWRWWVWLPLSLVVAGPWYVYIFRQAGGTLVNQFLWYEIFSRIVHEPHGHGGPPGAYLLLSIAGLLPWTVFVPGILVEAFKQRKSDQIIRLLLIWLAVPWIILEIIHSKLPHYIMPCYVALAILLARYLEEYLSANKRWPSLSKAVRGTCNTWIAFMFVIAVPVFLLAVGSRNLAAIIPAGVFALGFAITGFLMRRRGFRAAWICAVVTIVILHMTIGFGLLPALEPLRLSRNLAEAINELTEPTDGTYLCGYQEPTTHFYLQGRAKEIGREAVEGIITLDKGGVVLAITQRELEKLDREVFQRITPLIKQQRIEGINYAKEGRHTIIWLSRHGLR
jgi:4-amino-4-deoxy-L-arabinose transferase-like glycosyltransferase